MTTVFIITIYFYNTVYVDNSIFSTHVRLPKAKNAKILYSIRNILPVLFPLYRGPQNSFPNHEESSWAGGGGHPRLNGQPLAATGAHDVSSNGGSGGFSYSADATVKLALNGVRKRPVRSGAIKVDLSCADKSIRRPDSAPDLIRKETETNQYLGSFVSGLGTLSWRRIFNICCNLFCAAAEISSDLNKFIKIRNNLCIYDNILSWHSHIAVWRRETANH